MSRNLSRRRRVVEDDDYDEPDSKRREDDDEEEPRRGRSRRRSSRADDEPDEDEPPRRSRRSRREEPEEEEDKPRRSRRSRREESEEDDAPRRGRSSRDRSSSRSRRDDDDDDEPRGRGRKATTPGAGAGWAGAKEVKSSGNFAENFKTETGEEVLIKILDAEPFYNYREHWINEMQGRKSFVCLGKDECPLCAIGDKATGYSLFNVVDFSDPDKPEVKVWKCGSKNTGVLENYAKDKRNGPLDRDDLYFSVLKTGSKDKGYQTTIRPVKARDLVEDWDIEPLTGDEIEEFFQDGYEAEQYITTSTKRELKEIARKIED